MKLHRRSQVSGKALLSQFIVKWLGRMNFMNRRMAETARYEGTKSGICYEDLGVMVETVETLGVMVGKSERLRAILKVKNNALNVMIKRSESLEVLWILLSGYLDRLPRKDFEPGFFGTFVNKIRSILGFKRILPTEQATDAFRKFNQSMRITIDSLVEIEKSCAVQVTIPLTKFPADRKHKLPFVNRGESMRQLVVCLSEMKERVYYGYGNPFPIPVIDSPNGMGKSMFGEVFIDQLRDREESIVAGLSLSDGLMPDLLQAVTIPVKFGAGVLATPGCDFHKITISHIARFLRIREQLLAKHFDTVPSLLDALIHDWSRAIFLSLDELPSACKADGDDIKTCRDRFNRYTQTVLVPSAEVGHVYFAVLGRESFMSHLGIRTSTNDSLRPSPAIYRRIHLNPIRPEYIIDLVLHSNHGPLEHLRSQSDFDLESYSWQIYKVTSGHPRSICQILSGPNPENMDGPWGAVWPFEDIEHVVTDYQGAVEILHECHVKSSEFLNNVDDGIKAGTVWSQFSARDGAIDLTAPIGKGMFKAPTFQHVANLLYAGYGKNLEESFIQIPPLVMNVIEMMLFTLVDYCKRISHAAFRDFDYALVFEKICMKFFQSLLGGKKFATMGELLGEFLPETSILQSLYLRLHRKGITVIPRVLNKDHFHADTTIHTGRCRNLVDNFINEAPVIVLLFEKSHSPDVLIFPQVVGKEGESEGPRKSNFGLLVGIAAKNYTTTQMRERQVVEEIAKFRKIIPEREGLQVVLIVCATKYSVDVEEMFPHDEDCVLYSSDKLMEVILLRLDTSERRRKFFGKVVSNTHILDIIEATIAKDAMRDQPDYGMKSPFVFRQKPRVDSESSQD